MIRRRLVYGKNKIKRKYGIREQRSLHIAGATGVTNILLGLGKIGFGLASLSLFICVNGCYTLGMAAARYCALIGTVHAKEKHNEYFYYRVAGMIMITSSLLYIIYSIWSIYDPIQTEYGKITAITIATITFTEIGLNMRGVLKHRKSKYPMLHALKTIGLGTSLISLVLTQSAILSFTGDLQYPAINGFFGTVMGGLAALLGVYMIWRIGKIEKQNGGRKHDPYIGSR